MTPEMILREFIGLVKAADKATTQAIALYNTLMADIEQNKQAGQTVTKRKNIYYPEWEKWSHENRAANRR